MGLGNEDAPNPLPEQGKLVPGANVGAGRFILKQPLGLGGMGEVWQAFDQRLNEVVALKFLSAEIRNDPGALDDMRRETLKSHRLSHPNIIRIHDLFESPGEPPFISMEYVDGPSLAKFKANQAQRCFGWEFLQPLVQQLCEALDYAHNEGVIHRDLKPANMMLDRKGRLKLADFGIAALLSGSRSRPAESPGNSGTPAYMSPQQMDGLTPEVTDDIYALGATLYELLTSKPPFYTGDVLHQARNVSPDPIDQRLAEFGLNNPVPTDVAALIMACLGKNPEQRPQSARAVAEWIGLELTPATPGSAASGPAKRPVPVRKLRVTLTMCAVLAMIIAPAWWQWHKKQQSAQNVYQPTPPAELEKGWQRIFTNGNFRDWTADPARWRLSSDGAFVGFATHPSTLFSPETFTNYQMKVEVRFKQGALGAILLRGNRAPGKRFWPDGYQVIVGNSNKDYRKTGTLLDYQGGIQDVLDSMVEQDVWFTMHAIVIGNRIIVRVNDRVIMDKTDMLNRYPSGHVGLMEYGSPTLMFRNIRVKALPDDNAAALAEIRSLR